MTRAAIIVRLSREDLQQPGSTTEKLARHLAIAQDLAKRHNLPCVSEEDTYIESGISGRRLVKRPDTVRLLQRCAAGHYTHVVTAYQSRLLRGDKRDEADVEDAFLDGSITLITSEGVIAFDETYEASNAFMFEVRAAADRNYLRDFRKTIKDNNRERTLNGKRSAGMAPYGYIWKTARYEDRKLIDVVHYELRGELEICDQAAAESYWSSRATDEFDQNAYLALARRQAGPDMGLLPGVRCMGGEYAILGEIFTRIRSEGIATIVRSLNERGLPTAGAVRFGEHFAASVWHDSTLRTILRNPHYSGFPAHRTTTDRKGRKLTLPSEKHILPNEEQSYPHPIRLPEHRALLDQITARAAPGSARPRSQTLLTGILKCSDGKPCRANSTSYECRCGQQAGFHLGSSIRKEHANRIAVDLLRQALDRLHAKSFPAPRKQQDQTSELITIDREIRTKKRDLADLERHAQAFARSGGSEAFTAAITALREEIETAERNYAGVLAAKQRKEEASALTALEMLRRVPFDEFWSAATVQQQRSILRLVFAEIRLMPQLAKGQRIKELTITVQPWIAQHYNPGSIPIKAKRAI